MKRYPIEQIKELPIVEVARAIGMRVVKKGRRYAALCPAHPDRSIGSMKFATDSNTWYCWSCHSGGSVIDLVIAHEQVEYNDAIQLIAEKFGVEKASVDPAKAKKRNRLENKEYEQFGIKPFGVIRDIQDEEYGEGSEVITFNLKDEQELHDSIMRGKMLEKAVGILWSCDQMLNNSYIRNLVLEDVPGNVCDDLPTMIQRSKESLLLELLEMAERTFIDESQNPFPRVKWYKEKIAERIRREVEPAEVMLSYELNAG